jgi:hypothetical protein
MRLSPVAFAFFATVGSLALRGDETPKEDRTVYSTSGVNSAGRRHSMKVPESFVAGAGWETADVEGVALARIIEVAREALLAKKLDRGEEVAFTSVSIKRLGYGGLVFASFSVGKDWSVSIAVNALFQTIAPEEK